ncbi:hypothetical protein HDU96_003530 [Phlyctochytrium bullatum]|nr:hypothetical protein HDU96_003530 [Phlyctochytrium bullatum]
MAPRDPALVEDEKVNSIKSTPAPAPGPAVNAPEGPDGKISIAALRKALPPHVFRKSALRSTLHLLIDFGAIFVCMGLLLHPATAAIFTPFASIQSTLLFAVLANVQGFFMWSLFVVGHDAGHGTYSDSKLINSVVGHLSHGFLLVPFWPWQKSHAAHHAFHQHKEKDRGHTWFSVEEEGYDKIFKASPFFIPITYGIGYLLVGIDDGSHYFPWSKLHKTTKDRVECTVSALVCVGYLVALWTGLGDRFWSAYFIPWLIYNTWLYAVTYLQHHMEGSNVYGEGTWSFTLGAVETVDRVYDKVTDGGLDLLMHNITDGHVAHHLFSTSIPHYHLLEATRTLRPRLGKHYRRVDGFPFMELVKDHWASTRPYLVPVVEGSVWKLAGWDVAKAFAGKGKKE